MMSRLHRIIVKQDQRFIEPWPPEALPYAGALLLRNAGASCAQAFHRFHLPRENDD